VNVRAAFRGPQTAISWLTILPIPAPKGPFDRALGGAAIGSAPLVGALLGVITAAIAVGLGHTELPPLLAGLLTVGVIAILTRGMHLDGLSDTADGLGCFGSPERVHKVMHSGSAGPFGAATLVLVLVAQAVGYGTLIEQKDWAAIVFVLFASRVAPVVGCRVNLSATEESKFGALTAGTQRLTVVFWALGAVAVGYMVDPALPLPGVFSAVAVVAFSWWFSFHCSRRFAGINGDVLGALIELSALIAICGLLIA
jgi:adenosylcobinamide-GDP ribazoletransferase